MGTDIHLYLEKKNKEGKWERVDYEENLEPDGRSYDIFGFLAGVRDEGNFEPQFPDRNIPEDSSCDRKMWDERFHNLTHVYLDELLTAPWREAGLDECYFYIFCKHIIPRLIRYGGYLSKLEQRNVRLIIGFDS